jgi:putative transposase
LRHPAVSHLTQRGNYRQRTFSTDEDLLNRHAAERQVLIAGYLLMSNHIHLLAHSDHEGAISAFMREVHGAYARYLHGRLRRNGRLWQGRFYSCPLEECRLTSVLRYIERNPVRAQMVKHAADHPWSSAAAHLGEAPWPEWLDKETFQSRWTVPQWSDLLTEIQPRTELADIQTATRRTFPLGSEAFIQELEQKGAPSCHQIRQDAPRKDRAGRTSFPKEQPNRQGPEAQDSTTGNQQGRIPLRATKQLTSSVSAFPSQQEPRSDFP